MAMIYNTPSILLTLDPFGWRFLFVVAFFASTFVYLSFYSPLLMLPMSHIPPTTVRLPLPVCVCMCECEWCDFDFSLTPRSLSLHSYSHLKYRACFQLTRPVSFSFSFPLFFFDSSSLFSLPLLSMSV